MEPVLLKHCKLATNICEYTDILQRIINAHVCVVVWSCRSFPRREKVPSVMRMMFHACILYIDSSSTDSRLVELTVSYLV